MLRAGLVQLNVSVDPVANLTTTAGFIRQAASAGAQLVLTPEVTNGIAPNRAEQRAVLHQQADDPTLKALRAEAANLAIWLLIGSVSLRTADIDDRLANRSFLISPDGEVAATYDKIHMFDAEIGDGEVYRESGTYRPGTRAVLADTGTVKIGMTVCYDLRFPGLYRKLAQVGAQILSVPSAFSPVTGAVHWQTLLRARAIETGCFVLAPAQTGAHTAGTNPRRSWGHSLAISPWGDILADGGTSPGVSIVDLDMADVDAARRRIPSLNADRKFEGP